LDGVRFFEVLYYMYEKGLRKKGIWECADVEMALFSFASKAIGASR